MRFFSFFMVLCTLVACTVGRTGLGGSPDGNADEPPDEGPVGVDADTIDLSQPEDQCASSGADICDGIDNDCDPTTADGSDDPQVRQPCDGPDTDLCPEGTTVCIGGMLGCTDTTSDTIEICNGRDDDCDGFTDEPGAIGESTSWRDRDDDTYGDSSTSTTACGVPPGYVMSHNDCNDFVMAIHPGATEMCNGLDDDCNGIIDDGAASCPCTVQRHGTHAYLFCGGAMSDVGWFDAEAFCRMHGYWLVTIGDAEENAWVASNASNLQPSVSWWIGFNDQQTEGTWVWVSGLPVTFGPVWAMGQPDGPGHTQNCGVTVYDYSSPVKTTWGDGDCTNHSFPFICESADP